MGFQLVLECGNALAQSNVSTQQVDCSRLQTIDSEIVHLILLCLTPCSAVYCSLIIVFLYTLSIIFISACAFVFFFNFFIVFAVSLHIKIYIYLKQA